MPEEETKKPPQEGEEAAAAPEEKKEMSPLVKKLIILAVVLVVVAAEAVVAYFLVQATKQEDPRVLAEQRAKEQDAAARKRQTQMGMTTDPIDAIVNISAEGEEERYAKVAIVLEFDDTKYPTLLDELVRRQPKVRNILIEALASMQVADLMSPSGKVKLRQILVREVNKTLPKDLGSIRDVYLSEFILQ